MNIVLVHGILGFNQIDVPGPLEPIRYFNGVANYLTQHLPTHTNIHVPQLDPTAGTMERAGQLRLSIEKALEGTLDRSQPIHIIAHSMGGLDARRMISKDPFISAVPVKTLATIGTPHRGSPIADVVHGELVPKLHLFAPVLESAKALLGDVLGHFGISLKGLRDLTTKAATQFNIDFPDHEGVHYLSYGGKGRQGFFRPPTSQFMFPYYEFIRIVDGEGSDGVVPVSSAQWKNFDSDLWPADHLDEVGRDLDHPLRPASRELLDRYLAIVAKF